MTPPKSPASAKPLFRRKALPLPAFRPPQLATPQRDVPSDDNWLFELKYDGYRCQAAISGKQVVLYDQAGRDRTEQFGHVAPALATLTKGTLLLDGEICALDDDGRADFRLLKSSLGGKGPLVYFAFDLLEQDGEDIGRLPQLERKRRLAALLAEQPTDSPLLYSQHVAGNGQKVLDAIRAGGYGGIVAKWPTARYYSGGRSTAWLGIAAFRRQEFVVIGWHPAEYRRDAVDSLLLGTFENRRLTYRGTVRADLPLELRGDLADMLAAIETRKRPRATGLSGADMRTARWVQPHLLAKVDFIDVLPDGLLRGAVLKGVRQDQDDTAVHLELEGAY